jgi:uncharacterized membrane protein
MELSTIIDKALPGKGSLLDRFSAASHAGVTGATRVPAVRPLAYVLRGNEWLGHPLHPVVVALPIGAWTVTAWYDVRSVATDDRGDEHAADGALRLGIAGAVAAAVTGLVQYVDTRDGVRRETAVHAALNNVALSLYVTSAVLRSRGRRPLGRALAYTGLGVVGISGWLGGDIAFRHGVGVRPEAFTAPVRHS